MKSLPQIRNHKAALFLLLMFFLLSAQAICQKKYSVQYIFSGKDTLYPRNGLQLKDNFSSETEARDYINRLPEILLTKGFPVASVDTFSFSSENGTVTLYTGPKYIWKQISADSIAREVLKKIGSEGLFKDLSLSRLPEIQEKILNYFEETGYPFAKTKMEEVTISGNHISGVLRVEKGPFYTIDSINVHGEVKIKKNFLYKYLNLPEGSAYNSKKLQQIGRHINDLPYLKEIGPWNLTMLGSGSILNLYLAPKKSSRVDVLVGFSPRNEITGITQITADVNLDLKNALGSGENIRVNWQQLQPGSPRLKLAYNHPYVFRSNYGIDLNFDLLKMDSAYLDLKSSIGIRYLASPGSEIKVFVQNQNSYLLSGGADTSQIIFSKKLPQNIDVRSNNLGIGILFNNTDYRFNPRKGIDLEISGMAGFKKISKNNEITGLKDPANPLFDFHTLYDSLQLSSYRFTIWGRASKYFNFSGNNVARLGINAGLLQSPDIFQNELFQLGGYHLLRGFDEESIFAGNYAVFTAEYRYLLGLNSYFFIFSDGAVTHTHTRLTRYDNSFISGGAGLEFETRAGLLNISFAIGKRDDVKFDIRNSSKLHFGYINYF